MENGYDAAFVGSALTDTGDILISETIRQGLVDEMSIIVLPVLVGDPHPTLFESLKLEKPLKLDLMEQRIHPGGVVHLRYRVMA
ncbi:MAG: dihydrofolate reductase family protein [Candidatus Thermoplasmatota archaeon]|nr:dihydrofolate reductase family protein [Candidatus Thermoplasmatota archaeon]